MTTQVKVPAVNRLLSMQQCACWKHIEVMCFYCLLAVPLPLHISLHEQAQGPVVSSSCAVVLQCWSFFHLAEYISAGPHAQDSCSTGATEMGADLNMSMYKLFP